MGLGQETSPPEARDNFSLDYVCPSRRLEHETHNLFLIRNVIATVVMATERTKVPRP